MANHPSPRVFMLTLGLAIAALIAVASFGHAARPENSWRLIDQGRSASGEVARVPTRGPSQADTVCG